jgi:DNA-binding IclR family transcriptional regulator
MNPARVGAANRWKILSIVSDTSMGDQPPSQVEIAELAGCSRNTVIRHMHWLIANGYLVKRGGRNRAWVLP